MSGPACSDRARERGDALAGSGSPGNRWFLVEIDGPWGHSAFLNSAKVLDPDLGLRIVRRIEGAGMRTLAIRRPARRLSEARMRWAIVDCDIGSESIRWGEVDAYEELLDVPLDGSTGELSPDPIVAVCTHGRHDRCCAVRGRKVLPALKEHHESVTWECSHLGGDRFAGTMIVFPQGLYYGNVDDADVATIVDRHRAGFLDPRFLRGRSSLSAPVQVAQHHARVALHEERIDTLSPLSTTQHASTWTVELDHDGACIVVTLQQGVSEPITTTCAAVRAGAVRTFELIDIAMP